MSKMISDAECNEMIKGLKLRHIEARLDNNIGEVYLNNPPHNYLSFETMYDLQAVYDNLHHLEDEGRIKLRGIIITGKSRRVFSSGASLDMLGSVTTKEEQTKVIDLAMDAYAKLQRYHVPVIAAINGTCLGAGLELTLPCHYRVCGQGVYLGFPEIKLGFMPGGGGTQLLPRIVGRSKAIYMILSGKFFTAEECLNMGLVDMVVPRKNVMSAAKQIASELFYQHDKATKHIIQAIDDGIDMRIMDGLKMEQKLFWELVNDRIASGGISNKSVGLNVFREEKAKTE